MNLVPPPDPLREVWSDEPETTPSVNVLFIVCALLYGVISFAAGFALRWVWEMSR